MNEKIKRLPLSELLKRVGPGIILTGIVIGPGAITTASMIGSNYGYSLIWLLLPIIFMGITFMLTTYRIALLSGMPIIDGIAHYYGRWAAALVGFGTFLACLFFTIGNISGTGAGMNLVFGLNWKVGAVIMIVLLMYMYFSKNVYSKVEKGITLCIIGMIIAFYITLFGVGGPEGGQFVHGLTHWAFPAGSVTVALGFISTNASLTTGIYGTYLGVEKKWSKQDLFNGAMLMDAVAHIVGVVLISGAIVLVGAIVLHGNGTKIQSPTQLAELLQPIMGKSAKYIMGVALLGAGFSSLLGNTQRGVVLLGAGIHRDTALESKFVRYGSLLVILFSCIICFGYNQSPVQLIYIANVSTSIATPIAGFFITLMIWRKDIHQGYPAPRILQICMTVSYIFCLVLTYSGLKSVLPKILASFVS